MKYFTASLVGSLSLGIADAAVMVKTTVKSKDNIKTTVNIFDEKFVDFRYDAKPACLPDLIGQLKTVCKGSTCDDTPVCCNLENEGTPLCLTVKHANYATPDIFGKMLDLWLHSTTQAMEYDEEEVPGLCNPTVNGNPDCDAPRKKISLTGPAHIHITRHDGQGESGEFDAELASDGAGDCKGWATALKTVGGFTGPAAPFFGVIDFLCG